MIDLGALGFRRFCVLCVGFLCMSAALYFALSPDASQRQYVSVFMIGKSGLDSPIEKPERLIEYVQLKLMPDIASAALEDELEWRKTFFTNKPGSRFVRIITRADEAQADRVERLHRGLLKAMLHHQEQRLGEIREHLLRTQAIQRERLAASGDSISKKRRVEIKTALYNAGVKLESLAPAEVVENFSVEPVDKLETGPVRLMISLLLALLFVFLLVFLYALLNVRIHAVSVGSVR